MPSQNINKIQAPDSFYHVYVRGNNRQTIFIDCVDYQYFLGLLERYLSDKQFINKEGFVYPNYNHKIEINTYCLMPNHFHLLIYQLELPYLEKFMRSLMTSYSRYFNLRHKRTGVVFESRYKAVRIDQEKYLYHISRYIHLNPYRWAGYKYSSIKYYKNGNEPSWLKIDRILDQFDSRQDYIVFIEDYEDTRDSLNEIKHLLVDK